MDVPTSNTRKVGGSHKAEERRVQSSSSPSLPPPTSAQHKTRTRSRRYPKKGKDNAQHEATSLTSKNSPGAVAHSFNISSPAEKTDNWHQKNPSSPLNSMNLTREQLAGESIGRQLPPPIPISTQEHAASVPLAIRKNPGRQQWAPPPPPPLTDPEQSHIAKYRYDGDSCLSTSQATVLGQVQENVANIIKSTPEYVFHLNSLVAKPGKLREFGYVLNPLSLEDMEMKKRCRGCGKTMAKILSLREEGRRKEEEKKTKDSPRKSDHNLDKNTGPSKEANGDAEGENNGTNPTPKKKVLHCKFHPGIPMRNGQKKIWSCCRQHVSADPCDGAEQHHARFYLPGQMQRLWQLHPTPQTPNISSPDTRAAVAIDCEMGQAASGDSELIRITLIDYFSSAVLVDSLVYPSVKMEHYRTSFSGVSRRDMEAARKAGTCIMGRDNARSTVWRYVGPKTVVVGHAAQNDLESLRWIHSTVVDTHTLEAALLGNEREESKKSRDKPKEDWNAAAGEDKPHNLAARPNGNGHEENEDEESESEKSSREPKESSNAGAKPDEAPNRDKQAPRKRKNKGSGKLSLKTLARERLGRAIQNAGRKGHDSLEDALAARDLAHWHIVNSGKLDCMMR